MAQLDALLQHAEHYAAIVLEPLVQGAAGMRMARPEYIAALCQRCHAANVLVILDEVFTGFGRTGTLFAAHQLAVHGGHADMLCLSKGLTGGFLPMGATLTHPRIYQAFLGNSAQQAFLHGHSYTANPLACAAALASLDLLNNPSAQTNWQRLESIHRHWQAKLAQHPSLENLRVCGTIAAFEIKYNHNAYGSATSQWLRQAFMQRGILVRPLGNTLYWVPPYCTQTQTLNHAYEQLLNVLAQAPTNTTPALGAELF
jgi:adenosylmethionine-8-amino-7-oxononanoate aminotransferase